VLLAQSIFGKPEELLSSKYQKIEAMFLLF